MLSCLMGCKAARRRRKMFSSSMLACQSSRRSARRFRRSKIWGCTARFNWLSLAVFAMERTWRSVALGADATSIGTAALVALGDNDPRWEAEYEKLGTTAGAYDDWHEGQDPAGITTQIPELASRLDPVKAGQRLANLLNVMTLECQTIARACGKSDVHNLEPEDLVALTVEAAAMAQVPLAGTSWVPGND